MQAEHLQQWLREEMWEEDMDVSKYDKVVKIVQVVFWGGYLSEGCAWQMVTPKWDCKDFCGIGLVEVLWKATTGIINRRLTEAITYHNSLHGFWTGWGTGITILKANVLHHLTYTKEAVLNNVFLDLLNLYNVLDRYRCLKILAGYGVVPRALQILQTYWDRLWMVANACGYFGLPLQVYHGFTKGNPLYPTFFNVVLDAVIRHWVTVAEPTKAIAEGSQRDCPGVGGVILIG